MSQLTKQQLQVENTTNFPDNNTGYITPSLLREFNSDMIDSTANQLDFNNLSSQVATLEARTGSYATTASNTFTGTNYFNAGLHVDTGSLWFGNNAGFYTLIQTTTAGIGQIKSNKGLQIINGGSSSIRIDQMGDADLFISNESRGIYLTAAGTASLSGSISTHIAGVDFTDFSTSVDYRLNNTQGTQGIQGLQGSTGTQGTNGLSIQGAQGAIGQTGTQGTIGIQGFTGIQGNAGPIGERGPQGAVGQTGIGTQGIQGPRGNDGAQGTQGLQGSQGASAAQGATGTQGSTGIQGTVGAQGVQGIQGIQGSGANIDTASFATTGSNTFIGDQNINGVIYMGQTGNSSISTEDIGNTLDIAAAGYVNITAGGGNINLTADNVVNLQSPANANGGLTVYNSFQAPLGEGNLWAGGNGGLVEIPTASFATTGSNTFTGEQIVSQSIDVPVDSWIKFHKYNSGSTLRTSGLRFFTTGSGVDGDADNRWLNMQPVPFDGNTVAISDFPSNNHFMFFDMDNHQIRTEAGLQTNLSGSSQIIYDSVGSAPNIYIAKDSSGNGAQYPNFNMYVDSAAYAENGIYGGFNITDTNPSQNGFTIINFAANSYTPEYGPELVGWIGGGGNNTNGSNTAISFRTGSADMEVFKPIVANYPITFVPQGAPSSPTPGTIYFDSGDSHFYGYNGSSWKQLDN